jgi:alpha-L-arabinofuranosidase
MLSKYSRLALIPLLAVFLAVTCRAEESFEGRVTVRADQPGATINRNIYGQFMEHLGRCVYEGLWVGPESTIPNTRGIRNDVVAALRRLDVPVLRWPGGCFADEYHWKDGIGPREKRPAMINTNWGGVKESNAFGTHEFMDLCEQLGCEPYICGNLGSGTVQEMSEWVEYMTSDADAPLPNLRRQNGRQEPWHLKYFAVGNESWGCGGDMRPEFYADQFRRYNVFVRNYGNNKVYRVACGANSADYHWTDVVMSIAAKQMNAISLHYYTLPSGVWAHKGASVGFGEGEWHSTMAQTLRMDEMITRHAAIMDKYDPGKRIGLIVDEWGAWYDPEPGRNPAFLYQQNTLRDAVLAAINLDIFHAHGDRVVMANIAQIANVLQSMVLTDKERMIVTPTYWVMEMYKVHQGATLLPTEVEAPAYEWPAANPPTPAPTAKPQPASGPAPTPAAAAKTPIAVPALHCSASRDREGRIHLSLVNLDPQRSAKVTARFTGAKAGNVSGRVLTADAMDAHNTFDQPDAVKPAAFTAFEMKGDAVTMTLPAKSVVVLEVR